MSSPTVLQRVKDELRLTDSVKSLQGRVTADPPVDTVLIDVTVTDGSALQAQQIADAVGRQFAQRVRELETPPGARTTSVSVNVAQAALLPDTPVGPKKKLTLAVGLLIGLAVGLGAALLRDLLDTRIRDEETAAALVAAPALGGLPEDAKVRRQPLLTSDDPFSSRSEAFRQLRTNVRFLGTRPCGRWS